MSRSARILSHLIAAIVTLFVGFPAVAQNVPRPKPMREQIRAAGTIKDAGKGLLHVVGAGGDQWIVKVEADPQNLAFTGSAEENWLQPGMLVRFSGRIDRRGKLMDPIDRLTVITLREGYRIGITPENNPAKLGAGLFEDAKPEKVPAKKPAGPVEPVAVVIIGRIAQYKNGKLSIEAGTGKQIKADMEEGAKISIDVADLSWARPGDKIELQGWAYPQQKTHVFAQNVTVMAANPLVNEKKRPAAKESDKDDDDDGEKPTRKGTEKKGKPAEKKDADP